MFFCSFFLHIFKARWFTSNASSTLNPNFIQRIWRRVGNPSLSFWFAFITVYQHVFWCGKYENAVWKWYSLYDVYDVLRHTHSNTHSDGFFYWKCDTAFDSCEHSASVCMCVLHNNNKRNILYNNFKLPTTKITVINEFDTFFLLRFENSIYLFI